MNQKTECLVMAKPGGPVCNMRCGYCYYLSKETLFPKGPMVMTDALLEKLISERIASSYGPNTHFEWHGGEPTLLGIDYFKKIVHFQRKYLPANRSVTNGLQTNGLLLDDDWAAFLANERFSVGLSLDGPIEMHDKYRKTAGEGPAQPLAVKAFHLLKKHHVFCNILCVLHSANTAVPDILYDFFRDLGASYIQFLPLVVPLKNGSKNEAAAAPEAIGHFLCRIFDRWISEDVGRMVIQTFDEALRPIYGVPHALCVHRETCGDAAVLEHDGSFYACDHFVDGSHRIGNLKERNLADLAGDPAMAEFGQAKWNTLPQYCLDCEVLDSCNGGCPKDRISKTPGGQDGLNYLCSAYKRFFLHSRPELTRLAAHMKAGLPLRAFHHQI